MKYLLVLAVVLVAFWIWRNNRRIDQDDPASPAKKPPAAPPRVAPPADMVACRHCGLHLPGPEALKGKQGVYCSTEHRALCEG